MMQDLEEIQQYSSNEIGRLFENEVYELFNTNLKFEFCKKNYFLESSTGKLEYDVVAKDDYKLFVVQCKAADKTKKKDFKDIVLSFQSRAKIFLKEFKNDTMFIDITEVIFILWTKNIKLDDQAVKIITKINNDRFEKTKIHLEDYSSLKYSIDLSDKIGEYAKFDLFSRYNLLPPEEKPFELTALKTKLGGKTCYLFYSNAKNLLRYTFVARRSATNPVLREYNLPQEKEEYYQRLIDKNRLKNIAKFINQGGYFPANLILSIKKGSTLKFVKALNLNNNVEVGTLTLGSKYGSLWIIDGQHRLYSYSKTTNQEDQIPCIAFENMDLAEERKVFLDINKEQKAIDSILIWDLEGTANPESVNGIISRIVKEIAKQEPFKDKVYIPLHGLKKGRNLINISAFCTGIKKSGITKDVLPNIRGMKNPLVAHNTEETVKLVSRAILMYFNSLNSTHKDDVNRFILSNAGVPTLLYVLEPIISYIKRSPKLDNFTPFKDIISEYLDEIFKDVAEIKKVKLTLNGEAGRSELARNIGFFIREKLKLGEKFWPELEEIQYADTFGRLERRLASFVASSLGEITTNWFKDRVPSDIVDSISRKRKDKQSPYEDYLTYGQIKDIILNRKNWDEIYGNFFTSSNSFESKSDVTSALDFITNIRNRLSHARGPINKEDKTIADSYASKFNKLIPEYSDADDSQYSENLE